MSLVFSTTNWLPLVCWLGRLACKSCPPSNASVVGREVSMQSLSRDFAWFVIDRDTWMCVPLTSPNEVSCSFLPFMYSIFTATDLLSCELVIYVRWGMKWRCFYLHVNCSAWYSIMLWCISYLFVQLCLCF